MSSSREQSPDWLRSFQVPKQSARTVSSDPEPFPIDCSSEDDTVDSDELPIGEILHLSNKHKTIDIAADEGAVESSIEISNAKSPAKTHSKDNMPSKKSPMKQKRKEGDKKSVKATLQESNDKQARDYSVYAISSDSESCAKDEDITCQGETSQSEAPQFQENMKREEEYNPNTNSDSPLKKTCRRKFLNENAKIEDKERIEVMEKKGQLVDIVEEEKEKPQNPQVSSSRLPLVLSEKVQRTKALVECEGDSIDLSGDMGAVGRVMISDTPTGYQEMCLDLKGTIYKTTINPCRTFCVVSFGQAEAKIEAIMSDYIQLNPQAEFNEAETVVEGTLEGFFLDMDDDADGMPKSVPHNEEKDSDYEKPNGKNKLKAEKSSGLPKKRGRKPGSKKEAPVKVSKKKARVSKKATAKK